MKTKNILSVCSLVLFMGLILTACSEDVNVSSDVQPVKIENGFYVYPVDFECTVPGYQDGNTTRAIVNDWESKTSLFVKFRTGTTDYLGYLSYENNGWNLISTESFFAQDTSGTCEILYFIESNGDYYYMNVESGCLDVYNHGSFVKNTSITWNFSSFDLSESTMIYSSSASYTCSNANNSFTIKATLYPILWRIRFSGDNGTSIKLPASANDLWYCKSFRWSDESIWSISVEKKDIPLTVSNGYTPYIYGFYVDDSSDNTITVQNSSDFYTRNLNKSILPYGTSGVFTVPSSSNYSSHGWTISPMSNIYKMLVGKDENGRSWTWDTEAVDGAFWGIMGYCGGSGEEVGLNSYGKWWGVTSEADFMEQLQNTNDGKSHGDESLNAYMKLSQDGQIVRYAGDGSIINSGLFSITPYDNNEWKVADLNTTAGTILFPYEINSGGNMPTIFEIVYLSDKKLCLVYPDGGDFAGLGNWGEATFWHFKEIVTLFDLPYLNWGGDVSEVQSYMKSYEPGNSTPEAKGDYYLLWYYGKDKELEIDYYFQTNSGNLTYVNVFFDPSIGEDEIKAEILADGFTFVKYDDSEQVNYYLSSDKKTYAAFYKNSQGYWLVQYFENSSSSRTRAFEENYNFLIRTKQFSHRSKY